MFDLRQQPNIPVQHLAAIEPLVKNNLLTLPKAAAQSDQKGQSPAASLKALKRQLTNLSAALKEETNIDRRIIAYLDRLEGVIPLKRPTQFILFELGHEITLLQGYANQVNAEWPEFQGNRVKKRVTND